MSSSTRAVIWFAVFCRHENHKFEYLTNDPQTGELVSRENFESSYCYKPATLSEEEARLAAARMQASTGCPWEIKPVPNPCPSCSRDIWADDRDFCYPTRRDFQRWRAGCNEHDGGCGHEVEGTSFEDVMAKWNGGVRESSSA